MTGKTDKLTIHSTKDLSKLGTIMGIWAHPDDETYSMAGIMAGAVKNGQTVVCVTATKGEAGVQDETRWPASQLADIRAKELTDALSILGVQHHQWLDYADGKCNQVSEESAVRRLVSLIDIHKPDSIFTFGPDGMTGHDDHKTVSNWVSKAARKSKRPLNVYHAILTHRQFDIMQEVDKHFNVFFNIDRPKTCDHCDCAVCLRLDDELYDYKIKALAMMPSQTEGILKMFGHSLRDGIGDEAFVLAD